MPITTMQSRLTQYAAARHSLHDSILDCIGKTPIVKLQNMSPKEGVNVWLKLESENPGGSLKDRLAYGVIEWAEMHGHLKPGQVSFAFSLVSCCYQLCAREARMGHVDKYRVSLFPRISLVVSFRRSLKPPPVTQALVWPWCVPSRATPLCALCRKHFPWNVAS
jgi:hypothetical protein